MEKSWIIKCIKLSYLFPSPSPSPSERGCSFFEGEGWNEGNYSKK